MEKQLPVILIAEDDEDDYLLVRDAFLEFCIESDLRWVKNGEELLDYLNHRGPYSDPEESRRPGIILLDLNMPKKDGREALKEIKSDPQLRRIPVIALTTSNAEEDILYTYGLGVNSFIRKPTGYGEFVDVMKVFDKYWHEIVQIPTSD
jgi:two-component system, response regulator